MSRLFVHFRSFARSVSVLLAGAAVFSSACLEPTQMTVELTTDIDCKEYGEVVANIAKTYEEADTQMLSDRADVTPVTCAPRVLGTINLHPQNVDVTQGVIVVRASLRGRSAYDCRPPTYAGCLVARRQFSFAAQTTLHMSIALVKDCITTTCGRDEKGETCVAKDKCVSSKVTCDNVRCDIPR